MDENQNGSSRFLKIGRTAFLILWALAIVFFAAAYFLSPDNFTPRTIAARLKEFETAALGVYLALSIVRGLTLLPSTPLVLAGVLLFPHQPWIVLGISLFGIVASSSMIYWLSDALGIAGYFEKRKPHHVAKIRSRLDHPTGLLFVVLWAFFPLVPTDAVCYVAGSMRMNFPKFILAIFVGELILCSVYVFSGGHLIRMLNA